MVITSRLFICASWVAGGGVYVVGLDLFVDCILYGLFKWILFVYVLFICFVCLFFFIRVFMFLSAFLRWE